jgi:hypothetical protein
VNTSEGGPKYDICPNAELVDPSRNTTIFGSTADAYQDFYDAPCFTLSTNWDLWYKVVGNGNEIMANLWNPETDFDSQLSIYISI